MKLFLVVLSLLLLNLVPTQNRIQPADVVFKNGTVYTANDRAPKAQAIAVKADRIIFVGTDAAVQKYVGAQTRVVDLHGNTVLPGFTDAHQHLSGVGFREMTLNLEGTTSLDDLLAKVKARVDEAKPGEWVQPGDSGSRRRSRSRSQQCCFQTRGHRQEHSKSFRW